MTSSMMFWQPTRQTRSIDTGELCLLAALEHAFAEWLQGVDDLGVVVLSVEAEASYGDSRWFDVDDVEPVLFERFELLFDFEDFGG